jgi:hypothetical protein
MQLISQYVREHLLSSHPLVPNRYRLNLQGTLVDFCSCRPRFPGAVGSQLVTAMDFVIPSNYPIIPTYRVMNSDGVLEDETRARPNVSNEQALTWYKNMLTGKPQSPVLFLRTLITVFLDHSQHHGCNHSRSAETGAPEFLHGICR